MTEVMISIQGNASGKFLAYLIEAPNTAKQHTYGSLLKNTKTDVINAAYRMAHQQGLEISHIFDEDEGRSLPFHKHKVKDAVLVKQSPDLPLVKGVIISLEFHSEDVPQYRVWCGSEGSYLILGHHIIEGECNPRDNIQGVLTECIVLESQIVER